MDVAVPDVFVHGLLAMNRNALGDHDAAAAYARRVIAALPGPHNIGHEELIFALAEGGRMDEARAQIQLLLAKKPNAKVKDLLRIIRFQDPKQMVWYTNLLRAAGLPEIE